MSDLTKADLRERLGNIDQIRDILIGPQLREYSNRLEQLERNLASVQQEFRGRSEEVRQAVLAELQTAVETIDKKIRTLILKDEEEKFDIRQQIDAINKRIASTAEDLQESLSSELDELAENADKRFKSILAKDEEEKFDIRQQIEAMNKRVAQTAEELQESIAGELDELAENADKRFKSMQVRDAEEKFEIRQQLDLLSKRLSGNIEALDQNLDKQTSALHENLQETQTKFQSELSDLRTQLFEELERYCSMLSQVKVSRDDMAELLFELGLRLKGSEFVPELKEVANLTSEPRTILENEPEPAPLTEDPTPEKPTVKEPPAPPRKSTTTARRGRPGRLR